MNEDMLFFWGMGILFGLVMLYSKPPIVWKYVHSIIFLSYFVLNLWKINGNPSNVGFQGILTAFLTGLHIIIYLIGKLIFGLIRRSMKRDKERKERINQMP